jgi:antitoxin ParD1/3/4
MTNRDSRKAEKLVRLEALRRAIQAGVNDLEAGRCTTFDSFEALDRHLGKVAARAIAKHRANLHRK